MLLANLFGFCSLWHFLLFGFDCRYFSYLFMLMVIFFFPLQVAALFGDARRALDICRRATELLNVEEDGNNRSSLVTMKHVDAALQEMYSAPKIVAVRYVTRHCSCASSASVTFFIFRRNATAFQSRFALLE